MMSLEMFRVLDILIDFHVTVKVLCVVVHTVVYVLLKYLANI